MGCIGFENTLPSCTRDMYAQFSCPRTKTAGVLCGYGDLTKCIHQYHVFP